MEIGKFYKDKTLGFIQVITPIDKDGMVRVKRIYGYSKWVRPRKYWKEVTMPEMIQRGVIKIGDLVKYWEHGENYAHQGIYKGHRDRAYDVYCDHTKYGINYIIPIWALSPAEIEHLNK